MKNLILALHLAIQNNEQGELTFPSLDNTSIEEIKSFTDSELNDLGGNLIIDYNDSFDTESEADAIFWDKYLKPIDNLIP